MKIRIKKKDLRQKEYWSKFVGMDIDMTLVARGALMRYDDLDENSLYEFTDGIEDVSMLKKKMRRKNLPLWSKFVASELISAVSKYNPDKKIMSIAFNKLNARLSNEAINKDPDEWS